jgi:nuclear pore complex protein Nup155
VSRRLLLPYCLNCRREFDTFTEQSEIILSLALAKPKPGVFVDEIKHLMVICTTGSVIILGVSVVNTQDGQETRKILKLYATDMTVSTKSVTMSSVAATAEGRIFLSGNDGHLYELIYTSSESWFSAKVSLKNHTVSFLTSVVPSLLKGSTDGEHVLRFEPFSNFN